MRYFEDFKVGDVYEFGDHVMREDDIVRFAREFDPQPFHVDKDAAKDSIFGGLLASGFHTMSVMMRMMWDHLLSDAASLGSGGLDEIRWYKPVRPGDRLRVRMTILETIPSQDKPRGTLRSFNEVLNQDGEVVMSVKGTGMYRTRPRG